MVAQRFAEVAVNSPIGWRGTFSYSIPAGLSITPGQGVFVPFGDKMLQGVVIELTDHPAVEETRAIAGIIELRPLLSHHQVQLARWLSQYYLAPIFEAVALMLPPGFERKAVTFLSVPPEYDSSTASLLVGEEKELFEQVLERGKVSLDELEKTFGAREARGTVASLVNRGLLAKTNELEKARVKPKTVSYLHLCAGVDEAREEVARLRQRRAPKQAALLELLIEQSQPVSVTELRKSTAYSAQAAKALIERGLVKVREIEIKREPLAGLDFAHSEPLILKPGQKLALETIKAALQKKEGSRPFLLHGITGSGKTEIYLQALAETVRMGKRGIVLVPEIALTPQTIERFASRFPGRVAILHSGLSLGEQFDEWQRIKDRECDVVIGSRSAVFAPQPDLGLLVIDEEHEWTYKQDEKSPRYHARQVAQKLAELTGAVLVLGSATPDVETYYRAQTGEFQLLELPERVTSEGALLPEVTVVDMRKELKSGNRSIFSHNLSQTISHALAKKEQVLLFLNRRGTASFIQCRNCGFVLRCKRCQVAFTYHSNEERLVCHQCNRRLPVPDACPQCSSRRIKFLGTGTQKVEFEVSQVFPQASLLRWDSDVTGPRHSHEKILAKFRAHEADILIGTQMIAKGLDLPMITLVGVINADIGLNLPHFRAGERTFQLLCQVAGRAGRGSLGGRVIVQSYSPEHYAIKAAARQDYASFYKTEIEYRRQLQYPPFSRLVCLTYSHTNALACQEHAEEMKHLLETEIESRGIADLNLIGPAPAFAYRLRGKYRWQLILRGVNPSGLVEQMALPRGWSANVDPVGLA